MKKGITAIEMTDTGIILLQAEGEKERGIVTFYATRSIDGKSEEEVIRRLCQMLGSLPAKADRVCLLIPRCCIILRQMWLPSEDRQEIESMIGIKLLKDIPSSVEDMSYQYISLDKDDREFHRVLVMIARKTLVQKYYRILQKAGIKNANVTVSSLGVLKWFVYQQKMRKNIVAGCAALVDISHRHTEICFCSDPKLFFSRSFLLGKDHLATGCANELIHQIMLTLKAYRGSCLGPEVKKAFIVSEGKEAGLLAGRLQEETGLPVEALNPLEHVYGRLTKMEASASAAVLGAVLSPMENSINLAFEEECEVIRKETRKHQLVKFAILAMIAMILVISAQLIDIHQKDIYLKFLNKETKMFRPRLEDLDRKKSIVSFFDRKFQEYYFIPELMNELSGLTPDDVTFRKVSLDQKKNLIIQGYAKTHAGINDFQARLIRCTRFSDVKMEFATERTIAHKPVVDFKIISQLNSGMAKQL